MEIDEFTWNGDNEPPPPQLAPFFAQTIKTMRTAQLRWLLCEILNEYVYRHMKQEHDALES
jgi:hypothetical protein